MSARL